MAPGVVRRVDIGIKEALSSSLFPSLGMVGGQDLFLFSFPASVARDAGPRRGRWRRQFLLLFLLVGPSIADVADSSFFGQLIRTMEELFLFSSVLPQRRSFTPL